MKRRQTKISALLLSLLLMLGLFTACDSTQTSTTPEQQTAASVSAESSAPAEAEKEATVPLPSRETDAFSLDEVPAYDGAPYVSVHDNVPYFTTDDMQTGIYESYAPLDAYGRCGAAMACIDQSLMPTEKRGSIGQVKPSGWHTVKYDNVDGKYLYNRCHLIGYQLSGENANERNLITGTRYMNTEGMLPFENMVADYVKETDQPVLYRATPIFEGANLLASGVLLEGYSVEDGGADICFCVYAYNVQPGISIDYATGESWLNTEANVETTQQQAQNTAQDYVLNDNTMKFHHPDCRSVRTIKHPASVHTTRQQLIAQGYSPCGSCKP